LFCYLFENDLEVRIEKDSSLYIGYGGAFGLTGFMCWPGSADDTDDADNADSADSADDADNADRANNADSTV
jgi:hypothetical protein